MTAIRRPGVEVTQEFVTASPSSVEPTLVGCLVGACFQIVDAFDDSGNPQTSALAGTYRDGSGTVSYDLPGLLDEADISGFEDDIRVWLLLGDVATELNGISDEIVVVDNFTGNYTVSNRKFIDAEAMFLQVGVEPGDVLRITYRDVVIDVPIETVTSDVEVVLEAGFLPEDLPGLTYDIVKHPAQFIVATARQSTVKIGVEDNYLQFSARSLKFDGVTPAAFIGSLGDGLGIVIEGSESFVTGTDGATGDAIFTSAGATFLSTIAARGVLTGTRKYIVVTTPGDGDSLKQILSVFSNTLLIIETGSGVGLSAQTWATGTESDTGTAGATDGAGTTFTGDVGEAFLTSIPNTAGTPNQTTLIEIEGVGVYPVTAVLSNTTLTITGTVATQTLTGKVYTIILRTANGTDGATGALTDFVSLAGDFTLIPTPVNTKSVVRAEVEAKAVATVTSADAIVVSAGFAASGNQLAYTIPLTTAPLAFSYDADAKEVTVQLQRASGLSSSTYAAVAAGITSNLDSAFNLIVSDIVSATVTGSGTLTGAASLGTYALDGGADLNDLLLDADLIGSSTPTANVYVSYKALRKDVSSQAAHPSLLSFSSPTSMAASIGPVSIANPLALAFFLALMNAPTTTVKGIGVGDVSATKPFGTVEAFSSAFEFISGHEVYFVVPLTQDPVVGQLLGTHVTALSAPGAKAERVGFTNQALPLYSAATNIASGITGNTVTVTGDSVAEFPTSVNLAAAGVQAGDILVVSALASNADSPDIVNGTVGPLYGIELIGVKAGDDFVATFDGTTSGLSSGWNGLVDVDWTIYRAGVAITSAANQALEVQAIGEGYQNRRIFNVWPDEVFADINGTNFGIEGFYAAAAIAGMGGELPPSQAFTNLTLTGFTGLSHSNGYFTNTQLDEIAGGGNWVLFQEAQNAPLKIRHQLSTDVSTIENREFSITKSIDYVAKFLRIALSKQIGRFNITQSFLDALATTIQGLGRYLVDAGVIASFSLASIEQDETNPDTLNITVLVTPLYPCNYIALTIQI